MAYMWIAGPDIGREVRGRPLRYLLVSLLAEADGPLTVEQLVGGCVHAGVVFTGRPSKVVSDALRWEQRNGRVKRPGRGIYTLGTVPRSTRHWIRHRTEQARHWLRVAGELGGDQDLTSLLEAEPWPNDSWVRPWPSWPTSQT